MKLNAGFSFIELMVVIAIALILTVLSLSIFTSFNKGQALDKDVETIVETLNQARSQTISSKNESVYGVHITSTQVILFAGTSYSSTDPNNQIFNLQSTDNILTINLAGGGSDVIFNSLTGTTADTGTITVSSPTASSLRTVTIYATGLVDSQ